MYLTEKENKNIMWPDFDCLFGFLETQQREIPSSKSQNLPHNDML
jgi:hypothetical protein